MIKRSLPTLITGLTGLLMFSSSTLATESFESFSKGGFSTIKTEYGPISAKEGNAEIVNSGKTGEQSLRLIGGENKEVTLTLNKTPSQDINFSLWAERWTRQDPFQFSIVSKGSYGEKEIYKGDKNIKVGGFHSKIETVIPAKTTTLTFISHTPDGSGVKLDDLYIVPIIPMKVEEVSTHTDVYPVMVRQDYNPVLRLMIKTEGCLKPKSLDAVLLNFSGTTNIKDIAEVALYPGSAKPEDEVKDAWGKSSQFTKDGKIVIKGSSPLVSGENYFWVSVKLKNNADIDGQINTQLSKVSISRKETRIEQSPLSQQRIGYAVVVPGDYKSKFYRIPGLARTKKGTLLAVYDIRYDHSGDLPANIDVGVSRSTDGGKSWSGVAMCMDDSKIDPKLGPTRGVGDPAIMVDEKTGRIWVAAIWSHKSSIWGSKEGDNSPDACGQLVFTYSDDDGITWAKPVNVTDQTKSLDWKILFNGPGMGISTKEGTLVMPSQFWDSKGVPFSTIVYSKDGGKSWQTGTGCHEQTTEAQVVELADGSLMLNCRCNWGGSRVVMITKDLGQTWEKHSTNRNDLPEPVCQGSIIAVENEGIVKRALFFSNPATGSGRHSMTIKASLDDGDTWPEDMQVLYDVRGCWGYSCLSPADKKHIGVLYEGRGALYFLRIPYADILKK